MAPRGFATAVAAAVLIWQVASGAGQASPIAALLDRYQRGEFDAVVRELAARDMPDLRRPFMREAEAWIAQDPTSVSSRRLVAATLVLDLTRARIDTDWGVLVDLVDWSCDELRRGAPGPAERTWMMASIALGGRARDRAFLVGAAGGPYRRSSRHLDHALERFPNDPRLLMARVVTATFFPGTNTRARVDDFTQFVHDPVVGAEAEVRIAQLHIDRRDYEAALAHARRAAEIAKQASTVYIAHFLAGRSLEAQRRPADAARAYEAALNAVPDGQSASLMLAKLMVFSSQPAVASTIVERSLDAHPFQDDPWRLFPYGEFMHWPVLIAELRRAIE